MKLMVPLAQEYANNPWIVHPTTLPIHSPNSVSLIAQQPRPLMPIMAQKNANNNVYHLYLQTIPPMHVSPNAHRVRAISVMNKNVLKHVQMELTRITKPVNVLNHGTVTGLPLVTQLLKHVS